MIKFIPKTHDKLVQKKSLKYKELCKTERNIDIDESYELKQKDILKLKRYIKFKMPIHQSD